MTPLGYLEQRLGAKAIKLSYYTGPFADYELAMVGAASWDIPPLLDLLEFGCPVVEIGAGDGRIAIALADRGFQVFAIDSSPDAVKILTDRLSSDKRRNAIRVLELDALSPEFLSLLSGQDAGAVLIGNLTVNHFDRDALHGLIANLGAMVEPPAVVVGALTADGTRFFERFDGKLANSLFFVPFKTHDADHVMAAEIIYSDQYLTQRWFVDLGPSSPAQSRYCFAKLVNRIWTSEELVRLFADLGWTPRKSISESVVGGGLAGAEVRFMRFEAVR